MGSFASCLIRILSYKEVLEQVPKELEGNILESESWPMEELKEVKILRLVECDDWCYLFGSEGRIATVDNALQVGRWDFGGGDVQGEDLKRQLLKRIVGPFGLPVGRE